MQKEIMTSNHERTPCHDDQCFIWLGIGEPQGECNEYRCQKIMDLPSSHLFRIGNHGRGYCESKDGTNDEL